MRRYTSFIAIATLILLVGIGGRTEEAFSRPTGQGSGTSAAPSTPGSEPSFAPDRILVKTKEDVPTEAVESINRKNKARTEKKLPRIKVSVLKLPEDLPPAEAVEGYEASPDVEYAEPDYELRSTQNSPAPNDPAYLCSTACTTPARTAAPQTPTWTRRRRGEPRPAAQAPSWQS